MHQSFVASAAVLLSIALSAAAAGTPKRGGTLTYMIPADAPPSFDGHREATFATVHAVAPFYSVLVRVNPENAASTTDFVCDVCTEIPEPSDRGRTYAFPIRDDVRFEDGSGLTAYDVAASWNKIVNPPEGVISARRGYYSMIETVEAPDAKTVVFHLKYATSAFIPALADAPVREAGARHRGARNLPTMALSHCAVSQLCQRLEGEPEPLRQPGPGDDLARQVKRRTSSP
jgi:peptide/nickel transport system substrate-binding protein